MKRIKFILIVALIAICAVFAISCGESWERTKKDWSSEYGGGLNRTITVYDINGEVIEQFTGTFDIETDNATYILFDDQNGKRHIIYFSTATITIHEN